MIKNGNKVKCEKFYPCYWSVRIKIIDPLHGVNVHVTQSHLQSVLITEVPTDALIKKCIVFLGITRSMRKIHGKQELARLRCFTRLNANINE